jgi:hypothetical protein
LNQITNWVNSRPCGLGSKQKSKHAEEQFINQKVNTNKFKTKTNKKNIIVSIKISNGSFAQSKPCEACRRKCILAGFTHTYYHDINAKLCFDNLLNLDSSWSGGRIRNCQRSKYN